MDYCNWNGQIQRVGGFARHCRNNYLFTSNTCFWPKNKNLDTRANGNETSGREIDYIAFPNERRNCVANAKTEGVANPNNHFHRKSIQINIRYDIISTKKQNSDNQNVGFDIKQLRGNAITTQRDPSENENAQ